MNTRILVQAHELACGDKIVSPGGKERTVTHKMTVVRQGEVEIYVQTLTNSLRGWTSHEYQFNPHDKLALVATEEDFG